MTIYQILLLILLIGFIAMWSSLPFFIYHGYFAYKNRGKKYNCGCKDTGFVQLWLSYKHDGVLIEHKWKKFMPCPKCNTEKVKPIPKLTFAINKNIKVVKRTLKSKMKPFAIKYKLEIITDPDLLNHDVICYACGLKAGDLVSFVAWETGDCNRCGTKQVAVVPSHCFQNKGKING